MGCVCWAEAVSVRIKNAKTLHIFFYLLIEASLCR
jgi:hypothetical protein